MGKKLKGTILVPGYKCLARLGSSARSQVWDVENLQTGARFALKQAVGPDPAHRLQREFAILKRLEVGGVVKAEGFGVHGGREYFTMELIEGKPITQFLAKSRGKNYLNLFLAVFQKSLVILSDLHNQGIVHIDVKPSNLLVTEEDNPVLLDFGFAEDYVLSPTAEPLGVTLEYAAPELFIGGSVSPAADIYSLGAIGYEVLSGMKLWEGMSGRELVAAKLKTPPGFGKVEQEMPAGLEALVLRMLNPDLALRPSAAEILSQIRWLTKEGVQVGIPVMAPRLVFGGRETEMAGLERLVFDEKRVVILSGESGMGKTRLLRELRFKALVDGRSVLHIEGRGPYFSVIDYLASILGVKHPETDTGGQQRPDKWSRYERVYQAMDRGGFDAVFIDAPLDLSDDEAGFLGYVARGFDGKKGLMLSQAPAAIHPGAAKMTLKPLGEDKVTCLVSRKFAGLEGLDDVARLSHTLAAVAGGNPRRMNELLDILYAEGWLSWNREWCYEPGEDSGGLAESLEGWLAGSIDKLDENSRIILEMLALAEAPLPDEVIEKIVDEDAQMAIALLANAAWIRAFTYLGKPHIGFANDIIGPYLNARITAGKKKSLAGTLAENMEQIGIERWGDDREDWDKVFLVRVAELHFKGSVKGKTSGYLLLAGNNLLRACDFYGARILLNEALASSPSNQDKKKILLDLGFIADEEFDAKGAEEFYKKAIALAANVEEKGEILLKISNGYQRIRDLDKALFFIEEAEKIVPEPSLKFKSYLLERKAWNLHHRGKLDEALTVFEDSLKLATSPPDRFRALEGLAATYFYLGESDKSLEKLLECLDIAETEGDKTSACGIILHISRILYALGKLEESNSYLEKAKVMTDEIKHPLLASEVLRNKSFYLLGAARFRQSREAAAEAMEILEKLDVKQRKASLRLQEATCSTELGDYEEAHRTFRDVWREFHGTVSASPLPVHILKEWAGLFRNTGNYKAARRMLKKAREFSEMRNETLLSLDVDLDRCELEISAGDTLQAKRLLEECRLINSQKKSEKGRIAISFLDGKIHLLSGDVASAAELISAVKAEVMKNEVGFESLAGAVIFEFGKVLEASGEFEKGLEAFYEGLDIARKQERLFSQGLILYCIAQTLFEHKGCSEEAEKALDEAETIFERLGAKHQLENIRKLRARHSRDMKVGAGLSLRYLEGIGKVNELINRRLGEEDFMTDLLSLTVGLTGAERGMVFLAEQDRLHPVASQAIDSSTAKDACKLSRTIVAKIREEQRAVYTSDATQDERFNKSESILLNEIRSFICVPLKNGERILGTVYLDSRKTGLFTSSNLIYFENLANLLAASIDRTAEYKKLDAELALKRGRREFERAGIVIGSSPLAKKIYLQLEQVALSNTNILLEGETGTGKGVFARMIHERSSRREREFCTINCGILPENIFESELFGARKGAYTGATRDRPGLLEAAHCSTVFFDEITNTSLTMQAKLLEVIEEKVIRRMGDTKPRKVDLHFIFATNRNLQEEVKAGRFREDIFFRISAFTLVLPPLRERKEDIPEFVRFFTRHFAREFAKNVTGFEDDAVELLLSCSWPGNIRELRNVVERSVMLCPTRIITKNLLEQHFKPVVAETPKSEREAQEEAAEPTTTKEGKARKGIPEPQSGKAQTLNLEDAKADLERELIRRALAEHKTLEEAAKALGIDRRTLWRKKKALGL